VIYAFEAKGNFSPTFVKHGRAAAVEALEAIVARLKA
jgi:hypothetical protein